MGKVLQIPEFDEEDDLRSGILPDVHYDMLAFNVNNGYSWREVTLTFTTRIYYKVSYYQDWMQINIHTNFLKKVIKKISMGGRHHQKYKDVK